MFHALSLDIHQIPSSAVNTCGAYTEGEATLIYTLLWYNLLPASQWKEVQRDGLVVAEQVTVLMVELSKLEKTW